MMIRKRKIFACFIMFILIGSILSQMAYASDDFSTETVIYTGAEDDFAVEEEVLLAEGTTNQSIIISVADVKIKPNETKDVEVKLEQNTGLAGLALSISVPGGIVLNSIKQGAVLSGGTFSVNGSDCTWYAADNITANGVLLVLNITATDNAKSGNINIGVKDGKANNVSDEMGNTVSVSFKEGSVITDTGKTCEDGKHQGGTATCSQQAICEICQQPYGKLDPNNHTEEKRNAVEATCLKEGYTGDGYCKDCGIKLSSGEVIPKSNHSWDDGVLSEDLKPYLYKTYTCKICGETKVVFLNTEKEKLDTPKGVALEVTANGIKITWKDIENEWFYLIYRKQGSKVTKAGTSVTDICWYKDIGVENGGNYTYYVTATGFGYEDSDNSEAVSIVYLTPPRNLKVKSAKEKQVVLTWKKNTKASGYQIRYSLNSDMSRAKTINVKKASTVKVTKSGLKRKEVYYFQIRAYKKVGSKTYYSGWCKSREVKVK